MSADHGPHEQEQEQSGLDSGDEKGAGGGLRTAVFARDAPGLSDGERRREDCDARTELAARITSAVDRREPESEEGQAAERDRVPARSRDPASRRARDAAEEQQRERKDELRHGRLLVERPRRDDHAAAAGRPLPRPRVTSGRESPDAAADARPSGRARSA